MSARSHYLLALLGALFIIGCLPQLLLPLRLVVDGGTHVLGLIPAAGWLAIAAIAAWITPPAWRQSAKKK
ncbi:hypothetical protein PV703_11460 [Streptomyces sp. ME01-24h]|nr:hypothetical protein [Streptomyces sp. ME01-24h]